MRRSPENMFEIFSYDPESGVLVRKFKGGHTRVAGSSRKSDYYDRVSFNGTEYPAHRIIWELYYGVKPVGFIDHINGIKHDNRIKNLRIATDAENKRNVGKRKHNTSGFKGVHWVESKKVFKASASFNGKTVYLGIYKNPEDAKNAYEAFCREKYGEFFREDGETK